MNGVVNKSASYRSLIGKKPMDKFDMPKLLRVKTVVDKETLPTDKRRVSRLVPELKRIGLSVNNRASHKPNAVENNKLDAQPRLNNHKDASYASQARLKPRESIRDPKSSRVVEDMPKKPLSRFKILISENKTLKNLIKKTTAREHK